MEKKFKLGVIGAGFMSTAIVSGALKAGFLSDKEIVVSDISEKSFDKVKKYGVATTTDNSYVFNNSEFVLFAVKPQNFKAVIQAESGISCNKFISIMAGVKKQYIKDAIGGGVALVARCMPNTPCSLGYGAVGMDISDYSEESDIEFIGGLFKCFAKVVFLDEEKLNAVTGISGSSPAYFYLFAKYLIDAGVKNGLSEEDAKNLVVNTMIGSGKMVFENSDKTIEELIAAVCSKGGTTIEAVKSFENSDLKTAVEKAVDACIKRSEELESLL